MIETRWSGHLYAVQSIIKNFEEILSTLESIKNGNDKSFSPEDIALATGIFQSIIKRNFVFMLHFLNALLNTIEPANQILQKRNVGFRIAVPVIEAVIENIKKFRSDESFDDFIEKIEQTLNGIERSETLRPQRIRRRASRLTDFVVMETLGEDNFENENQALKASYIEIIDNVLSEMDKRFDNNCDILIAISELNNINTSGFDINVLKPLTSIGLVLPSQSELNVVQTYLANETKKPENRDVSLLKLLLPVKDAFTTTFRLLEAGETFGSSTAVNECSFSAVGRIDTVRRMCMTDKRLQDLSFLSFEKKRLSSIDVDDIMRKFCEKNRRIQLF